MTKLPQVEIDICARLREFREHKMLARPAVASRVGIPADRLAQYEIGRAPVRAVLALKLWEAFDLNPAWLATGEGPITIRGKFADCSPKPDSNRVLLSGFYKSSFRIFLESELADIMRRMLFLDFIEFVDSIGGSLLNRGEIAEINDVFNTAAERLKPTISERAAEEPGTSRLKWEQYFSALAKIEESLKTSVAIGTKTFTYESLKAIPTLHELLDQIRAFTKARGAKAELARELDVAPQQINNWLRGEPLPNGSTTLRLLAWTVAAEATNKQKGPTDVRASAGRRAKAKPVDENKKNLRPPPKK